MIGLMVAIMWIGSTACSPDLPRDGDADSGAEQEAIARILPAVVRIEAVRLAPNQGRMIKSSVTGSGSIISADGHVLTNYHVADNAEYFVCHLVDGATLPARLVGQDALTDLAVLQLDLSQRSDSSGPLPVATFGDSDRLQTGDLVFAVGSPASLSQAVTRGMVSNASLVLPEEIKIILDGENVGLLVRWILHDASIFPGNSGGPLVNDAGEIIGVNEIGVARLGGAIPGNLARAVSDRLIASGRVVRGWSGLTVQARLQSDEEAFGVLVSDVAPGSPAADAGLRAGQVIVSCAGKPITLGGDAAMAAFYRAEAGRDPGAAFSVDVLEGAQRRTVEMNLIEREPMQQPDVELRAWGAVFRDLTQRLVREKGLAGTDGVWIENVRPGGASGQADPELKRGDVVLAVDGQAVSGVDALREVTEGLFSNEDDKRTVLARIRRAGAELEAVVDLRLTTERNVTPQSRRAWLGVSVQPLTAKLSARLGVDAESGVRVTEVYPGTRAAAADLRVGDIIVAVDGSAVTARRAEDTEVFARQIRQYRSDTQVALSIWRDGAKIEVPVSLERQPEPPAEMPSFVDERLELTVRAIAFDDRVRLRLPPDETGLIVDGVVPSGWAALAGIKADDIIVAADEEPIRDLAAFRVARDAALGSDRAWWILQLKRAGQTLFVEVNLAAIRS